MNKTQLAAQVARILIESKIFLVNTEIPFKLRAGKLAPFYFDYRKILSYPDQWKLIINSFKKVIQQENLDFDIIAGVEDAGIYHSSLIAYQMKKPAIIVRREQRRDGLKNRIEGIDVKGKKVLMIVDHVSTAQLSGDAIDVIINAGADITDLLAICSFDFVGVDVKFDQLNVQLHTLTTFPMIIKQAIKLEILDEKETAIIEEWYRKSAKLK